MSQILQDAINRRRSGEQDDEPVVPPIRVGRFMTAEPVGMEPEVYTILDKQGADLGMVEWYPRWKQYVFMPDDRAVFSSDCLRSLAMFLGKVKTATK